ncbi:hypothetical protein SDC9_166537 [bioreactor metagenome]|uniref:Uncharacterized protein n=1 Tax=bioreactor metagenome TaxID=1076179 RepID=A0A645FX79_9ZZZZ
MNVGDLKRRGIFKIALVDGHDRGDGRTQDDPETPQEDYKNGGDAERGEEVDRVGCEQRYRNGAERVDIGGKIFAHQLFGADEGPQPDPQYQREHIRPHKQGEGAPQTVHQLPEIFNKERRYLGDAVEQKGVEHMEDVRQQDISAKHPDKDESDPQSVFNKIHL